MTETHFRDLTRKAMIREYIQLKDYTLSIIDASNELYSHIERTYEHDPDLQNLLDKFDSLVDTSKL